MGPFGGKCPSRAPGYPGALTRACRARLTVRVTMPRRPAVATARTARRALEADGNSPNTADPLPDMAAYSAPCRRKARPIAAMSG